MITLGQETFTRRSTWSVQGAMDVNATVNVTIRRATVSFCDPIRGIVGHTQFAIAASTDHPNATDFPGASRSGAGSGGTVCYEPDAGGWEVHSGITHVIGEDEWAGTLSLTMPARTTAAYFEDGGVHEMIELPEHAIEIPFEVMCTYASEGFGTAGQL